MKKCPFCGKENKDAAKFCTGCGKTLEDAVIEPDPPEWSEPAPVPASDPVPAFAPDPAPAPAVPQPAGIRRTPAQGKLKELAGSKLALIICIAYTVMLLCSIWTSAIVPIQLAGEISDVLNQVDTGELEDALNDALAEYDLDIDVEEAFESVKDYAEDQLNRPLGMGRRLVSAAYSNVLSILFAVALWIIYGVAKDTNSVCCGTTGLKILRVLRTVGLVLGIILMVIALLGMIFGIYMFAREDMEEAKGAMIAITIVCAVVFLLVLLFLCGAVSTLKKLISVSENSGKRGRVSGYVGFWLYVGGVLAALGTLGTVAAVVALSPSTLPGFLSCAGSTVYSFALGRFIFRCRKELKTV
jgi:hypothetical protein